MLDMMVKSTLRQIAKKEFEGISDQSITVLTHTAAAYVFAEVAAPYLHSCMNK